MEEVKESASTLVLLLLFSVALVSLPQINLAYAQLSVTIGADGTISPESAPVQRNGNIYTLTGGMSHLKVERSNTIIDGNGTYLGYDHSGAGTVIALNNVMNVLVKNCIIGKSTIGIDVNSSSQITISNNIITEADISMWWEAAAIRIKHETSNIRIVGNTIKNNKWGIFVYDESPNMVIHHNHFVQNRLEDLYVVERTLSSFSAAWDDGKEGNYWSNYHGADSDGDGIGDTVYIINENNEDRYPLMEPITIFDAGNWGEWNGVIYTVNALPYSKVSGFSFGSEATWGGFNVEEPFLGHQKVTIPKDFLDADKWIVLVDGDFVSPTVNEDANSTYLHFSIWQDAETVEIIGTNAIPEFPSWTPLLITLVAVLAVAVVYRYKLSTSNKRGGKQ